MSESTLVYANTAVTSAANAVSINRHTDAIYFMNTSATDVDIKLNGSYTVRIGNSTNFYTEIIGDYTTFQIMTANVSVSVYAIG